MPTINLWATEGYINTPDGNSIYIWGFTDQEGGSAQLPGPIIIVKQVGPQVETEVKVNLTNKLNEPVSLIFPGQEGIKMDGRPVQPRYRNGNLFSFSNYVLPGKTETYTFTVSNPGTFLYESSTNPSKQVPMGLYGCIIVRPWDYDSTDDQYRTAYGAGTDTEFDREYLLVMGEIDPILHKAVEKGLSYDYKNFMPRYWTINGRCATDTMHSDGAAHLPNQPYGAMIKMEQEEKVLLRYAGAGVENHPMHPHGNHTRIIGLDGRILKNQEGENLSYYRFTVLSSAGQTCDQIFTWSGLGFNRQSNPVPTVEPNMRNLGLKHAPFTHWSGSPYLGEKGELPQGVVSYNEIGEYYFMLHSHSELEITNWGIYPGGLMTMIAVYPKGTLGTDAGLLPEENPYGS